LFPLAARNLARERRQMPAVDEIVKIRRRKEETAVEVQHERSAVFTS
jgi:hypothetical protein